MKKNLLKLGALAVALVVLFAACAQPTEEASSGSNKDTIIRLYLDRPDGQTLKEGDSFQLRVGQQLFTPLRLVEETFSFTTTAATAPAGTLNHVDGSTATSYTPGTASYPAGEYTITRKVWRANTRAAGTGEGGTANVGYLLQDRERIGTPVLATWMAATPTNQYAIRAGASATGGLTATTGVLLKDGVGESDYTYTPSGGSLTAVGTDNLQNVALLDDTIKFVVYEREDGQVFIGADAFETWGVTNANLPYHTAIENNLPTRKYYETGIITITPGTNDETYVTAPTVVGGVPKVVTTDSQYYVDLVLVNRTVAAKDYGATLKGSVSAYIELEILTNNATPAIAPVPLVPGTTFIRTTPATPETAPVAPTNLGAAVGGMPKLHFYMYTKEKHGFNTWNTAEGKWNTNNANVKKVNLKSGINEVRLSYFSKGEGSVEF
jgi:hypothetical protein